MVMFIPTVLQENPVLI